MAEIKTIQFELWHNCNNNCEFCFLKTSRIISNSDQQIKHIQKVIDILNSNVIDDYDGVALIGGEFFEGQLNDEKVKLKWFELITLLSDLLKSKKIKQIWITASLIDQNQQDLYDTLQLLPICNDSVIICTSYDSTGRFRTQEREKSWHFNVKTLKEKYPNIIIHTTIITTQHFIEKVLGGDTIITDINVYSLVDFKLPTFYVKEFVSGLESIKDNNQEYRKLLLEAVPNMPKKFFIEKRLDFINFIKKIYEIFGKSKLESFCSHKVLSDSLYLLSSGVHLSNRWNDYDYELAKCGHHIDSYCYLDSPKCVRCDIVSFINDLD